MAQRKSTLAVPTQLTVRLATASPALNRVVCLCGGSAVRIRLAA